MRSCTQILRTRIKIKVHICNLSAGDVEETGRFFNLTCQTSELQAHQETPSQQMKYKTIQERHQMSTSGFDVHTHANTLTCASIHMKKKKENIAREHLRCIQEQRLNLMRPTSFQQHSPWDTLPLAVPVPLF